ncbi:MAG TPA: carbohydrate-binding protein [Chthoniobacteraceae bacterium]|jgi:hypothetical protein|nr:carbohydrate-binding protein [Chthoniobacteraceae bacterium]
MKIRTAVILMAMAVSASATEYHVAVLGDDGNPGTPEAPLRTIQHAADIAQPGDVITVHSGIYRERIDPPRGGLSDSRRIIYQAAPGEKVTITGSEIIKGWKRVSGDTWKVAIPSKYFGSFNPYGDSIHGDWFGSNGFEHHTGAVYLNGDWMIEAPNLDAVLAPVRATPRWYGQADGAGNEEFVLNLEWMKAGAVPILPERISARNGSRNVACAEGGSCVGFIRDGDWLRYNKVDFGSGTDGIDLRVASVSQVTNIELRLDNAEGELLGTAHCVPTGGWQRWATIHADIKHLSGKHSLCVVFKAPPVAGDGTTIWAQFKGVDPNHADAEINVRNTVFTPRKTGINYITVRGFTLCDAATNWAPPTAGQIGLITAYWCKGWIIEDNDIHCSTCCGVSLGKYGDQFDNTSADTANGYILTLTRALKNGWNKGTVGSHIVRNNHISFCGQTGIVGSLGCSYSTVSGNEIHDIHNQQSFGGAEMAGIKFHGAIDVTISHNHIYRCGKVAGIWLDWMGQGAQIVGNLMHDNSQDIFLEMQHGPILVANNILLSPAVTLNSQGVAFVHNLMMGRFGSARGDTRVTPFQAVHSTEVAGMYPAAKGDSGDDRFYNNLVVAPCNLNVLDNAALPCLAGGNVYLNGAQPPAFDSNPLTASGFDPDIALIRKPDGWYLGITLDPAWSAGPGRKLVTTDLLGKALVPGEAFENADGSALRIAADYLGVSRNAENPFPGPFEAASGIRESIKVW